MDRTTASRIQEEFGKGMTDLSGLIPTIFPETVEVLSDFLGFAARERVRVLISGGGTLPEPVLIDDTVRLSLSRMNRVIDVHAGDSVVVAQAGVIVDHAVEAAADENLLVPLDPSSGALSTVGGAYMTAATGPYASGYGLFRDAVIGVKCVTSSGDVVEFGGRTMKNVTGFEITRFLAGSHGLYAVVAELTMKAFPHPEKRIVLVGRFRAPSAPFDAARRVETAGTPVKFSELIAGEGLGGNTLIGVGLEGMEGAVDRAATRVRGILEDAGAESVNGIDTDSFTRARRAASEQMVRPGMVSLTVPPSAIPYLLDGIRDIAPGSPVVSHPLSGRVHILLDANDSVDAITSRVLAVGGKRPQSWGWTVREGLASAFTREELAIARSLKRSLDPAGILNSHFNLG